ncbi:DUF3769 domain-containing protein [Calothrix rhizosoleniae]|uniref:DUF3769 domain-containing protein n=1 Tax=Calothrix rhizosoleniae TaxID=888997 RepID=UPI000B4A33E4|nr:DUF3769 domain-containing protein [Calothrix rhizosoleniae]
MLHPVLPPAVPPLLGNLTTNLHSDVNYVTKPSSARHKRKSLSENVENDALQNSSIPNHKQNSQSSSSADQKIKERLLAGKALSTPSSPELFPAEFSSLTAMDKAAPLGGKLSVGYSIEPSEQKISQVEFTLSEAVQPTIAPNLSPSKTLPKEDKSSQPKNIVIKSTTSATEQKPIQINFNSDGQVTPATIEFKSRSQESQVPATDSPNQPTLKLPSTNQEESQPRNPPPAKRRIVEVIADRQEYDEQRRVITAEGKVVVRFDGAVIDADRLQVNLDNLIAVGEGNVTLARGKQILRGNKFTYNFIQDRGELQGGRGEIFIPTLSNDFSFLPTDVTAGSISEPVSDRLRANQPQNITSPGAINITLGGRRNISNQPLPKQGGAVNKLRFEAGRVDFYPRGWRARDVKITNDPFSPPELELRANQVTLTQKSPLEDRIKTKGQRLVFDRGLSLPIPRNSQTIDRRERDATPALVSFGFDGDERGGLFLERSFQILNTEQSSWTVTPQFLAQEAIQSPRSVSSIFALKSSLNAILGPQTQLRGSGSLTSLDLSDVDENLRANVRLRQQVGDLRNPHNLTMEFNYRDRLFNGTLGFQTVQSSIGGVLTSPIIPVAKGINFSYQTGAQYITANTDRQDLLDTIRNNDRISLGRIQGSAALNGGLLLWSGKPLPATAKEGLRYTSKPVVPFLTAFAGITGTSSYYTNGDNQSTLTGTIGLQGQLGHFSKPFFDYTGFNITFSQGLNSGESPFLFDRSVDNTVLSAGITQQIYGPLRLGFQTSVNLDTGEASSTDYILEYSRRTYGITVRYNPVLELAGISFRISDFNWSGGTDPFSKNSEVKPVVGGVKRGN